MLVIYFSHNKRVFIFTARWVFFVSECWACDYESFFANIVLSLSYFRFYVLVFWELLFTSTFFGEVLLLTTSLTVFWQDSHCCVGISHHSAGCLVWQCLWLFSAWTSFDLYSIYWSGHTLFHACCLLLRLFHQSTIAEKILQAHALLSQYLSTKPWKCAALG